MHADADDTDGGIDHRPQSEGRAKGAAKKSCAVLQQWDEFDGALLQQVSLKDVPPDVLELAVVANTAWVLVRTASSGPSSSIQNQKKAGGGRQQSGSAVGATDEAPAEASTSGTYRVWACTLPIGSTSARLPSGTPGSTTAAEGIGMSGVCSRVMLKTLTPAPISVSRDGRAVASFDRFTTFVWQADLGVAGAQQVAARTTADLRCVSMHHTKRISCTCVHPSCSMVASGDHTGRILVWHGLESALYSTPGGGSPGKASKSKRSSADETQLACTTYHWHAQKVLSICFSRDGRLLLSGGEESVLVVWDIENGGSRSFLPRIGGALRHIACDTEDEACAWVVCDDNAIRRVNLASRTVEGTARGVGRLPRGATPSAAGLLLLLGGGGGGAGAPALPTSGSVTVGLSVSGTCLQLLRVSEDGSGTHLGMLKVAPRNLVTTSEELRRLEGGAASAMESQVILAAVGNNGASLCTVDVRPDGDVDGSVQCCLRFWEVDAAGDTAGRSRAEDGSGCVWTPDVGAGKDAPHSIVLNTVTDMPHDDGVVTALAMHKTDGICATASDDGSFKLWARRGVRQTAYFDPPTGSPEVHWQCVSVGSYMNNVPLTALAFSDDGSTLAVGTTRIEGPSGPSSATDGFPVVTLWEVRTNLLVEVIPCTYASTEGSSHVSWLAFADSPGNPRLAVCVEHGGAPQHRSAGASTIAMHSLFDPTVPQWTRSVRGCSALTAGAATVAFASADSAGHQYVTTIDARAQSAAEAVVGCWRLDQRFKAAALTCVPATDGSAERLVIMTRDRLFMSLALRERARGDERGTALVGTRGTAARTDDLENGNTNKASHTFANTFGARGSFKGKQAPDPSRSRAGGSAALMAAGERPWKDILDAPVHALPPLSDLCVSFLDSMIDAR